MRVATASFLAVLLAAPLTVACGGSPIGPTQNPTAPRVITLTPGSYFLALAGASENVTTPGGQTFSTYLCAFVGSNSPTSGKFLVTLEPADSSWVGRAVIGTLKFTFSVDRDSVLGEMSGSATSVDGQVKVDVSALVTGTFTATDTITGGVKGQVNFSGNSASASCSANQWTLSRR